MGRIDHANQADIQTARPIAWRKIPEGEAPLARPHPRRIDKMLRTAKGLVESSSPPLAWRHNRSHPPPLPASDPICVCQLLRRVRHGRRAIRQHHGAPSAAKAAAMARPMPLAAPTITATCPFNPKSINPPIVYYFAISLYALLSALRPALSRLKHTASESVAGSGNATGDVWRASPPASNRHRSEASPPMPPPSTTCQSQRPTFSHAHIHQQHPHKRPNHPAQSRRQWPESPHTRSPCLIRPIEYRY